MKVHVVILQYQNEFDSGIEIMGIRRSYESAQQLVKDCLITAKLDYCCDHLFSDNGNLKNEYINDENIAYDVNDKSIYIADHWHDTYVSIDIFTEKLI
jgi:hypothetical protein